MYFNKKDIDPSKNGGSEFTTIKLFTHELFAYINNHPKYCSPSDNDKSRRKTLIFIKRKRCREGPLYDVNSIITRVSSHGYTTEETTQTNY